MAPASPASVDQQRPRSVGHVHDATVGLNAAESEADNSAVSMRRTGASASSVPQEGEPSTEALPAESATGPQNTAGCVPGTRPAAPVAPAAPPGGQQAVCAPEQTERMV